MNTINTNRLVIRAVQRNEARQYCAVNELRSESEALDQIQGWDSSGATQLFFISRNASGPSELAVSEGTVVGFIKITRGPPSEVSIATHWTAQGRGYMREGCRSVFTEWFRTHGSQDLFVETRSDNAAVIALMDGYRIPHLRGNWSRVGSISWTFGWATWRYAS
ncbi:hypothetical protein PZA11_007319 [Diplocarpon coronariae]